MASPPAPAPAPPEDDASAQTTSTGGSGPRGAAQQQPNLPPLSRDQFRQFNRLAEEMDRFHSHFRETWEMLSSACATGRRPRGMTAKQFTAEGLRLCRHLHMHHNIEESLVFPRLAARMPEFRKPTKAQIAAAAANNNERESEGGDGDGGSGGGGDDSAEAAAAARLTLQHRRIHGGMDALEAYLDACHAGTRELDWGELRALMESWGDVLLQHLDEEVRLLGADNMRKHWSAAEIRAMPM
ncbi:hypothetical protein DFJ73DRAFT_472534 [Zopfochytrium polystomum]|nr:hypothetical protein DFJ73DRAFT_472534 [Zopfochytrium polystomum]